MKPYVSILIPAFNAEEFIEETINSALDQTITDIEIIIVDNHSTDSTWELVQAKASQDKRIRIFRNDENIGPVKNWKRCISEAKGELAKIIWADDYIAPEFLEKTIPLIENSEVAFVYTKTRIFKNEPEQGYDSNFHFGDNYTTERFIEGSLFDSIYPVSPGCALFRTIDLQEQLIIDIPNKIGANSAQHAIGNDLLLFLLTAHKYSEYRHVDEVLSFFRMHDDSITMFSDKSKLVFYYDIAKAFFIETYMPKLSSRFSAVILFDLLRYGKFKATYNIKSVQDFYFDENLAKLNGFFAAYYVLRKLIRRLMPRLGRHSERV